MAEAGPASMPDREKARRVHARLIEAGVPARYRLAAFNRYDGPKALADFFAPWSAKPEGFAFLHGEPSRGKTFLAVCCLRRFAWSFERSPIRYATFDLVDKIRESLDREFAGKYVRDLADLQGLLVLDDIGTQTLKDWTREQIARIVYVRYDNLMPTLLTSNHDLAWLAQNIDQRVADRIMESGQIWEYTGPNRRAKL